MGASGLQLQTESGPLAMPNNICCVVVEYLPGGALKSYLIKNRRRKLTFKIVVQLALDLARGYYYILSSFACLLVVLVVFEDKADIGLLLCCFQVELPSFAEDCSPRCKDRKHVVRQNPDCQDCRFWSCES